MWNLILTVVVFSMHKTATTITTVQFKSLESCKVAANVWKKDIKLMKYNDDQIIVSAVCAQE